jgi:hypothetical protein
MKKISTHADSKFHGDAPFMNVDVVFESKEQLKVLIEKLQLLLESGDVEHIELEDSENSKVGLSANIYFHRIGYNRDETDISCIKSAEDLIMRYQNS